VLITVAKLHPFLALIFGPLTVGIVAGQNPGDVLDSFGKGFGDTAALKGGWGNGSASQTPRP
jgi:gluconate:H+ symporter, GntP family